MALKKLTDFDVATKRMGNMIPTMNKTGFMASYVDDYTQEYIEYAAASKYPCLEVGAAYGIATVPALMRGAKVVANDLCAEHLEVLQQHVPEEFKTNLKTHLGRFPDDFQDFKPNSFGVILASRVVHFLKPDEIVVGMEIFKKILVPGGKLVIVNDTPYLKMLGDFYKIFEARKKQGDPWPAYVEDFPELVRKELPELMESHGHAMPSLVNFFDSDLSRRMCEEGGFTVEKVGFMDRQDYPDHARFDGRESVGIIATKPL